MKEVTNTASYTLTPEGTYRLTVVGRPEKRRTSNGKNTFRIWKFKTTVSGTPVTISILMFPYESRELLLAVGGKEIRPNEIEWDDEFVDGKTIIADLVHEPDKTGQLREKLKNVRPEMELPKGTTEAAPVPEPWPAPQPVDPNDEVAWDE